VRELDGVADEIDNDLPQPVGIARNTSGTPGLSSTSSSSPFSSAPPRAISGQLQSLAQVEIRGTSSMRPASILEKSSMALSTTSSASAEDLTVSR